MLIGDEVVLLNRGVAGRSDNVAARYPLTALIDARGSVVATHRLDAPLKVEGIAAQVDNSGMSLCLVTDVDDPTQASQLLLARL